MSSANGNSNKGSEADSAEEYIVTPSNNGTGGGSTLAPLQNGDFTAASNQIQKLKKKQGAASIKRRPSKTKTVKR